jgi:hypothetical protein
MFISLTSGFDGSEVETVEVKMRADLLLPQLLYSPVGLKIYFSSNIWK